jgi:hypothetical protein
MDHNIRNVQASDPSSPQTVQRLKSCSFGQRAAAPIEVASVPLLLDNSLPQRHTNSMNNLYAEPRFGQT